MILRRLGGGDEVYNLRSRVIHTLRKPTTTPTKNSALIVIGFIYLNIRVLGGIKMNKRMNALKFALENEQKEREFYLANARRTIEFSR